RDFARDDPEQRGLAGAVAADQADAGAGRQGDRGAFEQNPPADRVADLVEAEHGGAIAGRSPNGESALAREISAYWLLAVRPIRYARRWGEGRMEVSPCVFPDVRRRCGTRSRGAASSRARLPRASRPRRRIRPRPPRHAISAPPSTSPMSCLRTS